MTITFDPAKRAVILKERGINVLDATKVFAGATATWVDDRFDYGETRYLTAGLLANRMVVDCLDPARQLAPGDLDEVLPCQGSSQVQAPVPRSVR